MRRLAALLILAAAPVAAQDADALTARVAQLEVEVAELRAEAARDAEIIASLTTRLEAAPSDPLELELLGDRIRNLVFEVTRLSVALEDCTGELSAAERDLTAAERSTASAVGELRMAEARTARVERSLRAVERELRREETDARRLRSRLRACR